MRRLAALLLIVIAASAQAAGAPKHITVVAQPALRPVQTPAPRPAPALASAAPTATWAQSGVDGAACRTSCAQSRYFCEADPNADDCGSAWSQCVAACGAPALSSASAGAAGN